MSGSRKRHAVAQPGWEARRGELARQDRLRRDPEGSELLKRLDALYDRFSETAEAPTLAEIRDIQYRIALRMRELEVM